MLTVACVLSDPMPGRERIYTRDHVERLMEMVAVNITEPFKFVCVDDSPFPGYWAKISLFEPGRFDGRVFYLDLDVTVTGDLTPLAFYPALFSACQDWGRFGINSSVMAWDAGVADHLFTDFTPAIMDRLRGDQDYITINKPDAAKFPRQWCYSYRLGQETGYPEDMRVCVYHGRPKPWTLEEEQCQNQPSSIRAGAEK